MKKLLAIIVILLIIFICMYIYKNNNNKNVVNVSEVENIEDYISNIYMWKEITDEALPKFDNINNAPDLWIWEVVKKNLEEYELTYDQIEEKAKEIFGQEFNKSFPKEGLESIQYDENTDKYLASGVGLDSEEDDFILNKIEKKGNEYEVEIIEYIEDYTENMNTKEDEQYNVYIKNLNNETIASMSSTDNESKSIDIVKQNVERFTKKIVVLSKNKEGKIFIKSVK